jgi:hypothetical protein
MIASSPTQAGNPDDIDRLLGDFFRGEVPQHWPAAPLPRQAAVFVRPTTSQYGGRLALAASVAALLLGGWLLSGRLPSRTQSGSMDDTKATLPTSLRGGSATPINPRR